MYQITCILPQSKHTKSNIMKMDDEQNELFNIVIFCRVLQKRKQETIVCMAFFTLRELEMLHFTRNATYYSHSNLLHSNLLHSNLLNSNLLHSNLPHSTLLTSLFILFIIIFIEMLHFFEIISL